MSDNATMTKGGSERRFFATSQSPKAIAEQIGLKGYSLILWRRSPLSGITMTFKPGFSGSLVFVTLDP